MNCQGNHDYDDDEEEENRNGDNDDHEDCGYCDKKKLLRWEDLNMGMSSGIIVVCRIDPNRQNPN